MQAARACAAFEAARDDVFVGFVGDDQLQAFAHKFAFVLRQDIVCQNLLERVFGERWKRDNASETTN